MTEEEKDKMKAILMDMAAELADIKENYCENSGKIWFEETAEAIREI